MIVQTTDKIIQEILQSHPDIKSIVWNHGDLAVTYKDSPNEVFSKTEFTSASPTRKLLERLEERLENLDIRPGDYVTTFLKRGFTVGSIETEPDGTKFVVPEGADEYTYWIPFCNVIQVERPDPLPF